MCTSEFFKNDQDSSGSTLALHECDCAKDECINLMSLKTFSELHDFLIILSKNYMLQ